MKNILVRLDDGEYKALNAYAKTSGKSMNKALKDAFFEMLEEQYDIELFDKAYAKYKKHPRTYSTKEVLNKLNIDIQN